MKRMRGFSVLLPLIEKQEEIIIQNLENHKKEAEKWLQGQQQALQMNDRSLLRWSLPDDEHQDQSIPYSEYSEEEWKEVFQAVFIPLYEEGSERWINFLLKKYEKNGKQDSFLDGLMQVFWMNPKQTKFITFLKFLNEKSNQQQRDQIWSSEKTIAFCIDVLQKIDLLNDQTNLWHILDTVALKTQERNTEHRFLKGRLFHRLLRLFYDTKHLKKAVGDRIKQMITHSENQLIPFFMSGCDSEESIMSLIIKKTKSAPTLEHNQLLQIVVQRFKLDLQRLLNGKEGKQFFESYDFSVFLIVLSSVFTKKNNENPALEAVKRMCDDLFQEILTTLSGVKWSTDFWLACREKQSTPTSSIVKKIDLVSGLGVKLGVKLRAEKEIFRRKANVVKLDIDALFLLLCKRVPFLSSKSAECVQLLVSSIIDSSKEEWGKKWVDQQGELLKHLIECLVESQCNSNLREIFECVYHAIPFEDRCSFWFFSTSTQRVSPLAALLASLHQDEFVDSSRDVDSVIPKKIEFIRYIINDLQEHGRPMSVFWETEILISRTEQRLTCFKMLCQAFHARGSVSYFPLLHVAFMSKQELDGFWLLDQQDGFKSPLESFFEWSLSHGDQDMSMQYFVEVLSKLLNASSMEEGAKIIKKIFSYEIQDCFMRASGTLFNEINRWFILLKEKLNNEEKVELGQRFFLAILKELSVSKEQWAQKTIVLSNWVIELKNALNLDRKTEKNKRFLAGISSKTQVFHYDAPISLWIKSMTRCPINQDVFYRTLKDWSCLFKSWQWDLWNPQKNNNFFCLVDFVEKNIDKSEYVEFFCCVYEQCIKRLENKQSFDFQEPLQRLKANIFNPSSPRRKHRNLFVCSPVTNSRAEDLGDKRLECFLFKKV